MDLIRPLSIALLLPAALASGAELFPGDLDHLAYEADFADGDPHDWEPANDLEPFDLEAGYLSTEATGADAYMLVTALAVPTADISHIRFRMRSDKSGSTQVYFATTASPDPASHPVPAAHCPGDGQWHEFELQLGGLKGFSGDLTMLRLDPVNGGGEDAKIHFQWVHLIQKAPMLVFTGFSADRATLELGEQASLTLRLTNFGGGSLQALDAELVAPGEAAVSAPLVAPVTWSEDGHTGEAVWQIEAKQLGLPTFRVVVSYAGRSLLEATTRVPIIDWDALPEPGAAGGQRELSSDRLSLLLLGPRGKHGAALLRVKQDDGWKAVGVLAPLAHYVYQRDGVEYAEELTFGYSEGGPGFMVLMSSQASLDFRFARSGNRVRMACEVSGSEGVSVRRFSGPVLRVGVGKDGSRKTAALFPGLEFLGKGEPSSNVDMVGEGVGFRPSPPAYQVTCPSLAVLKDDILCGLMWHPLKQWGKPGDVLPVAEFASPNFLDGQPNHRLACFVPGEPWRQPNQSVAATPYQLGADDGLSLTTDLFARAGADITDAVPIWYETYGMPHSAPLPHSPERALDLCIQGWADTLWFPQERGFNNHWHTGQTPYWDGGLATNILVHSQRTGENRWVEALELEPDTTILDLVGSLFTNTTLPDPPEAITTQRPSGLWTYEPPPDLSEKVKKWTDGKHEYLGRPGSLNVGISANNAIPILSHALLWADRKPHEAAISALRAMMRFRVPRGCQGWEVHTDIPDIYAAARLIDCYRMGYELTGQEWCLDRARYWAYTGLPFLYAYEVPDTGPGASVHIPWPEDIVEKGELAFWDPDAHHPTPWGAIPVFGTSFYKVSWFGNIVQWCGLCWASSVYSLLEYSHDDVLRAAADGVVYSGIHQTFDKEPYVGLLPDTWHLSSNIAHPALIGPVRLEAPLRKMIDEPEFGRRHTKSVGRREPGRRGLLTAVRARVSSRGQLKQLHFSPQELRWTQRFPVGQVCETMVIWRTAPRQVLVGDEPLPQTMDILNEDEGWQRFPEIRAIGLRVRHDREWETVSLRY